MRDRKHGRLEEKKINFTQMLKGNIKVLPVISFTLRDKRQREHGSCELKGPFKL